VVKTSTHFQHFHVWRPASRRRTKRWDLRRCTLHPAPCTPHSTSYHPALEALPLHNLQPTSCTVHPLSLTHTNIPTHTRTQYPSHTHPTPTPYTPQPTPFHERASAGNRRRGAATRAGDLKRRNRCTLHPTPTLSHTHIPTHTRTQYPSLTHYTLHSTTCNLHPTL